MDLIYIFVYLYMLTLSSAFDMLKSCLSNVPHLELLPGSGWNALRNIETNPVFEKSYVMCKLTNDGRFKISDQVEELPNYQNLTVTTHEFDPFSVSTFLVPSFPSENVIFGTFTLDYHMNKLQGIINGTTTMRTLVKKTIYHLSVNVNALDSKFKQCISDAVFELHKTDLDKVRSITQFIVQNYGTHVITQVKLGNAIISDDHVSSLFVDSFTATNGNSALNFLGTLLFLHEEGLNVSMTPEQKQFLELYKNNTLWSMKTILGDQPHSNEESLINWILGLNSSFTRLSQSGMSIAQLLTPEYFPDVSPQDLSDIQLMLNESLEVYYDKNTHKGCMNPSCRNFKYKANINNICIDCDSAYSFGGIFETCQHQLLNAGDICGYLQHHNTLTNTLDCPVSHFKQLITRTILIKRKESSNHIEACNNHKCFPYFHKEVSTALYSVYWCKMALKGQFPFSTFGGAYSPTNTNPLTLEKSCPPNHVVLGTIHSKHVQFCGSTDLVRGYRNSVQFGGFIPCNSEDGGCPVGYEMSNAGTLIDNCDVRYCTRRVSLQNLTHTPFYPASFTKLVVKSLKSDHSKTSDNHETSVVTEGPVKVVESFTAMFSYSRSEYRNNSTNKANPNFILTCVRKVQDMITSMSGNDPEKSQSVLPTTSADNVTSLNTNETTDNIANSEAEDVTKFESESTTVVTTLKYDLRIDKTTRNAITSNVKKLDTKITSLVSTKMPNNFSATKAAEHNHSTLKTTRNNVNLRTALARNLITRPNSRTDTKVLSTTLKNIGMKSTTITLTNRKLVKTLTSVVPRRVAVLSTYTTTARLITSAPKITTKKVTSKLINFTSFKNHTTLSPLFGLSKNDLKSNLTELVPRGMKYRKDKTSTGTGSVGIVSTTSSTPSTTTKSRKNTQKHKTTKPRESGHKLNSVTPYTHLQSPFSATTSVVTKYIENRVNILPIVANETSNKSSNNDESDKDNGLSWILLGGIKSSPLTQKRNKFVYIIGGTLSIALMAGIVASIYKYTNAKYSKNNYNLSKEYTY